MVLVKEGNPYIIDETLIIPEKKKLVIKEGCVLLFKNYSGITAKGDLSILGTETEPVIFTSFAEKKYNPVTEQLPNPFDWNGILIDKTADTVIMNHFSLSYSVYGLQSQKEFIKVHNGLFNNNGQFNFTINGKIQPVNEGVPFSYNVEVVPDIIPISSDASPSKNKNDMKWQIVRYSLLGTGIIVLAIAVNSTLNMRNATSKLKDISANPEKYLDEDEKAREEGYESIFAKTEQMINRHRIGMGIGYGIGGAAIVGFGISFKF